MESGRLSAEHDGTQINLFVDRGVDGDTVRYSDKQKGSQTYGEREAKRQTERLCGGSHPAFRSPSIFRQVQLIFWPLDKPAEQRQSSSCYVEVHSNWNSPDVGPVVYQLQLQRGRALRSVCFTQVNHCNTLGGIHSQTQSKGCLPSTLTSIHNSSATISSAAKHFSLLSRSFTCDGVRGTVL